MTCLPDSEMKLFNYDTMQRVAVDWSVKDRPFEQIRSALSQKAMASTPGSEHVIPEFTPISIQNGWGTCVCNAWCDMLEMVLGLENPTLVYQLSRMFLYWVARYLTGDTGIDAGTFLRAAANQLMKIGVVLEEDYPYIAENLFKSPELDLYTLASNNRIKGFYKMDAITPDNVELAIRSNHPPVFSVEVIEAFLSFAGGAVVGPPNGVIAGRHAMIATGVRYVGSRRQFKWRNSWSDQWGDGGHCWVTEEYMNTAEDVWVGTKLEPLI